MERGQFMEAILLLLVVFKATANGTEAPTKIFIAGGKNNEGYLDDVQLLDISSDGTFQSMATLNKPLWGATGALVNEKPIICGGYDGQEYRAECYHITKTAIIPWGTMSEKRAGAASIVVGQKLWVSGGANSKGVSSSSDYMSADGETQLGPELVQPLFGHAMIAFNNSVSMVIGGVSQDESVTAHTHYYNHEENHWHSGPELKIARGGHTAGFVSDQVTGDIYLIVAGGYDQDFLVLNSVEILDSASNEWQPGPELLEKRFRHGMVRLDSDLIAIGGYNRVSKHLSSMERLTCRNGITTCKWTLLSQKLKRARSQFVAIAIPDDS